MVRAMSFLCESGESILDINKERKGYYNLHTYTWNLGDASLTFHNGTMVPF